MPLVAADTVGEYKPRDDETACDAETEMAPFTNSISVGSNSIEENTEMAILPTTAVAPDIAVHEIIS